VISDYFQQKKELSLKTIENNKNVTELLQIQAQYENLIEKFSEAVFSLSLSGSILQCNKRSLMLFGFKDDYPFNKQNIFNLIAPTEHQRVKTYLETANENCQNSILECIMIKNDNKQFHAELNISLVRKTNNEFTLLCIIKDSSEQKRTELEKSKIEEQFRSIYKMEAIGQLAGGIAHDFNNILGAVSGYADIIINRYSDDEKLQKYAKMILSASNRSAELTNKLLTFARKSKLQMVPFDAHLILADVADLLKHSLDKKINISYQFNASESCITGDTNLFQSAIMNLALNARDAMPQGGDLVLKTDNSTVDSFFSKSRSFTIAPGYYLSVSVIDNGAGMDKQLLAHLFEPFFTTKDIGKGTGLGLASVYGTIKSHNGYIDVESSPGNGSTFTLYLPITMRKQKVEAAPNDPIVSGLGRILFVDDENFMRDAVREMLTWLGYTVTICADGKEALELFSTDPEIFDLIILDMMMPGINGLECFRQMKKINSKIKVLISTGYSIDDERESMLKEGIIAIIQKPFVSAQLAQAVQDSINTSNN
jgi:PAS domain S-box-containing protein